MELFEVNPYVRFCAHQKCFNNPMFVGDSYLVAYDCRMLYCLSGTGKVEISNTMYNMEKDTLLIFKNNLEYRYYHNSKKDMECISVNFDYDYRYATSYSNRIPPDSPSKFNAKQLLETDYLSDIIYVTDASKLRTEVLQLFNSFTQTIKFRNEELSARMKLIITISFELFAQERINTDNSSITLANKICKFIDENAENISSGKQISEVFSYHSYYINRILKKNFGCTLHNYIIKAKINKSIDYLTTTQLPVSEIAYRCGFFDSAHFSKHFKKITGYSPTKYRYI